MLASGRYTQEIKADEQHCIDQGISGLPAIVLNCKMANLLVGAQPPQAFRQAIRQTLAD